MYRLFFNETLIFQTFFFKKKFLNIEFHENPLQPSCSMRTDARRDRHEELTVTFRNFAKSA